MDTPAAAKAMKVNPFLPYWAVLQADVRQTLRGWVYRTWVLVSILVAVGYLLWHGGIDREAGMVQFASIRVGDLLRWSVLGSVTLIIILTAGSISSERGTMADSVLSRGISRYHYFLAKWHSRLFTVLGTFLVLGMVSLGGSLFLLHEDLQLNGSLVAFLLVSALLAVVVTGGVTVSAMLNSTMLGITLLWILVYGTGFLFSLVPGQQSAPHRILNELPTVLRGHYDWNAVVRVVGWSAAVCGVTGGVGLGWFARRDV